MIQCQKYSGNIKIHETLQYIIKTGRNYIFSINDSKIGVYACGPTVYDYAHIGHMRKYTMDDVLVRTLEKTGWQVNHVMNITDVGHLVSDGDTGEDKMEKGARKTGKTVWEVAQHFEEDFWQKLDRMEVRRPDTAPRATDHIAEQIAQVQALEKKRLHL